MIKLVELKPLESAKIIRMTIESEKILQRLFDLGLKPNQEVTCLQKSPLGGVTSYQLSHGTFALEDWLAEQVIVEKDEKS